MAAERDQYGMVAWRRSSASDAAGNCVEVAAQGSFVLIRDSRDRRGGTLKVTAERWREFVRLIGASSDRLSAGVPLGR
jgi:hypothetical protein